MKKRTPAVKRALFHFLWLAIVIGGVIAAVIRYSDYGVWGPAAIIIGAGMLTVFVADRASARKGNHGIKVAVGDLALLFIILAIAVSLLMSAVFAACAGRRGSAVVFALFCAAFCRIFFEYFVHLKKAGKCQAIRPAQGGQEKGRHASCRAKERTTQ